MIKDISISFLVLITLSISNKHKKYMKYIINFKIKHNTMKSMVN